MKRNWWKILAFVLIIYTIIAGLIVKVPQIDQLEETIRNLFFHVCMWFTMVFLLLISFFNSIRYLSGFKQRHDIIASQAAQVGLLFGILGIVTGMVWAKFTWGEFWVKDPKLNGAAVGIMIYLAYMILRSSLDEETRRAKVAAVYNIFAFVLFIVFIGILPRLAEESIHPGKEGNPAMPLDLDMRLRYVFYPAIIGWILIGVWILNIKTRLAILRLRKEET